MEPDDNPRASVEIKWNAGYRDGKPRISNFLFGASWSHHHSFPARKTHLYLGFWTLTFTTLNRPKSP